MKRLFLLALSFGFLLLSCSKQSDELEPQLSLYQLETIDYFKEIALGFEFGTASKITRKWDGDLKAFIGGKPSPEILAELDKIKEEINTLCSDGFTLQTVSDSLQSNYYIFFGSSTAYVQKYPNLSELAKTNWGLFSVYWSSGNTLNRGHMYVDTERANLIQQKHLLREELTQSLGLAQDSPEYPESIFQSAWTTTNSYAPIDKELIRLLYHPDMKSGLDATAVELVLSEILLNE
ncbi:DUF2927 domain-containing protein [Marinilongibacter aquaticus]|uniref:DUF2927 domain-containing protein n=1 Tax=Marinilongibacter aquaticus TaxID=2975157 RepID=UPI0021BD7127|nr:DUF2927 domain-containing protein [Marinilongibacter aquaticus]UBM57831.1 DUF2927 domain-containing protein [Marinilongibacter aquaticus]